jgi:hypothetical protein
MDASISRLLSNCSAALAASFIVVERPFGKKRVRESVVCKRLLVIVFGSYQNSVEILQIAVPSLEDTFASNLDFDVAGFAEGIFN